MLNNLTNFFNLIKSRLTKTALEPSDLIAVGTKDPRFNGGYKPTTIKFEDLSNQIKSYKSYTVSLSQQTVDPPEVEVEFENTLEVTATFTRVAPGDYIVTFDKPIFNSQYDYAVIHQNTFVDGIGGSWVVGAFPIFFNVLSITTYNSGTLADEVISTFTGPAILEIRVYN